MNTADEQAAQDYYTLLGTYIRELNNAHKGIRRLVRRNRKLEQKAASISIEAGELAVVVKAANDEFDLVGKLRQMGKHRHANRMLTLIGRYYPEAQDD